MLSFVENNRDNLEHVRKKFSDLEEKLDTLMSRLTLEEKKLRMEGKIYFFSLARAGTTTGQLLWFSLS